VPHLRDGFIVDKVGIVRSTTVLLRNSKTSTDHEQRRGENRISVSHSESPPTQQKINPRSLSYFQPRKSDRKLTTISTQPTTNSPQKHHIQTPQFPKHPKQNTHTIKQGTV